jgi:uncharacterized protein YkwD
MDYSMKEDTVEYVFDKAKQLILPSEENNFKSRFLQSNILLYCVVLLLALKIVAVLITINIPQNVFFADITKSTLENFVNQTRQSVGLLPLTESEKLDQAAQLKADNMVQNQYFDHTSPSGITPWAWFLKAGYVYKYAGENLAIGFYESQEVYDAWLNSPSHKANIVNPNYTEVGTAILSGFGPNNSIVVVQEFGSPAPAKIVTTKTSSLKTVVTQATTNLTPTTSKPVATTKTQTTNTKTTDTQTINNVPSNTQTSNTQTTSTPPAGVQNSADSAGEKVLSQSTESQNSIVPSTGNGLSGVPAKVVNSVLYNYNGLLQDVTYGVSLVVIGIVLTLIFFSMNITFRKQLVFRAVLIVAMLSVTALINKELIVSLIPHQIII